MIKVVIYKSPTKWVITEIARSQMSHVRDDLMAQGYHFVFVETNEDS